MKKAVLTTLQVVITLTILYFVFRNPDKRAEMGRALGQADHLWLLLGLAMYGAVEVIAGLRWQLLLRVQGISLGWIRLVALMLVGLFFNFFIPGGTGGDMVKIFYLLKETPGHRAPALLSVLVDRLFGLVALTFFAGILAALRWHWLMSSPETAQYVWTALIILGSSIGGLHFTYMVTKYGWIHKLPARLPGRDKLAELALAYNLYGKAWRASLLAIVLSVGAHVAYFGVFYCASESYRHTGSATANCYDLFTVLPLINTITAMPISIGGIGVREHLYEIFLGRLCGVSEAVAVVISSTGYLLTLAWGLIGGLAYIFYRPSEHARLSQMKREVAEFEHTVAEEERALEAAAKRIK